MFRNGYDYLTYIFWKVGRTNFTIWYFELEILVQVGIEAQGLKENYSIGRTKCYRMLCGLGVEVPLLIRRVAGWLGF